jgi:hypothetical protein
MNIETIKNALKAHASLLNIVPVSVADAETDDRAENKKSTAWTENKTAEKVSAEGANSNVENPAEVSIEPKVEGVNSESQIETPPKTKTTRKSRKKAEDIPAEKVEKTVDLESIIAKNLRAGVDYDTIPNCGRKPALLKAGAEHLAQIFKFKTTSEIVNRVEVFDKNFILYEVATKVYNASGEIIAVGLGSCNTLERKYIKQGLAMSLNTVLKMARKRSYVDAILSATGTSRIFTQDIEELKDLAATIEVNPKE